MTYHMIFVILSKAKYFNYPHGKYLIVKIRVSTDINNSHKEKQYILIHNG